MEHGHLCDFGRGHQSLIESVLLSTHIHTGQCKSTGGCYNELVVAYFGTGGGVKWRKR